MYCLDGSKVPSKFKRLSYDRNSYVKNLRDEEIQTYHYIDEQGLEHRYVSIISSDSKKIVDDSLPFVNGFKRVLLESGHFSFVEEKTGKCYGLFNIAGDFNEYGFAMVGTKEGVSWISREMKIFCVEGSDTYSWKEIRGGVLTGLAVVSDFSNGYNPLSLVCRRNGWISYMNKAGRMQFFYRYTGEGEFRSHGYITKFEDVFQVSENRLLEFITSHTFDNKKFVLYDDLILFPSGDFCKTCDMLEVANSTGLATSVAETLEDKDRAITIKRVDNQGAK